MDRIVRALHHVWALFAPRPAGRHRAACPAASAPHTPTRIPAPAPESARPRQPRFADPLFAELLFEGERDMVRPYVLLYEQRQERKRQEQRRRILGLALDGIDAGPRFIHGVEVAR